MVISRIWSVAAIIVLSVAASAEVGELGHYTMKQWTDTGLKNLLADYKHMIGCEEDNTTRCTIVSNSLCTYMCICTLS